jgi:hypothetical protein
MTTAIAGSFTDPFKDSDDGWLDMSDWVLNNATGFLPLPIIITEPALGAGLGLAALFFHPPKEEAHEDVATDFVLPSISAVAGAYTSNESWFVGGGHFGTFKRDTIRYTGGVGYASINLKYYPFEGTPSDDMGLKFNSEGLFLTNELLFRWRNTHWFVGLEQQFLSIDSAFDLSELAPVDPVELDIKSSFVGLTARYEDVDSIFTPSRGLKFRLSYERYGEAIGGDFDANKIWTNVYKYFQIGKKWNLGLRADGQFTNGDIPFFLLPYIDLRGIPMLRYTGDNVIVGETEARWQFHRRVSLVGFMGIGWAAESVSDFNDVPSRVTKGLGIRYYAARKLGMHAGIDVAKGPEDTYYYLTFGSAWR